MRLLVTICLACLLAPTASAVKGSAVHPVTPVERDHFIYYFDHPRYLELADSSLNAVRGKVATLLGDSLAYKPEVHLVGDAKTFGRLLGGHFPDWGAAAAVPMRKLIVVKSPDGFNLNKPLTDLLPHEYAHLAVASRTGRHSAPRWFDEGFAMYVSSEWGWSDNLALSKTAVFGDFLRLSDIENLNRFNESLAHVAYAQSFLAVKYLLDSCGDQSLVRFLESIRQGEKLNRAILAASGSEMAEFERDYQQYLSKHYNIVTLFMDTMFLWVGLAVVVVIGAFMRYRKRRSYYEKWDREERLQSTDFDYGDPDNPEQSDDDEPWRG